MINVWFQNNLCMLYEFISFLIFLIVEKRRKDNIVTFDIRMLVPKITSLMNKSAENAECFPKSLAFPI